MVVLIGFFLLAVLLWAMNASAKRRRAEANLKVLAAYAAGLTDAAHDSEPPLARRAEPPPSGTPFQANRIRPTPESRRLGYWGHPPCDIVGYEAILHRLATLEGSAPEICFTGFSQADEDHLRALAEESGFRLRTTVTKHLTFLCAGEGPGPSKLARARDQNCPVISAEQFSQLAYEGWDLA